MAEEHVSGRFLDAGEEPTEVLIPIAGYETVNLMSLVDAVAPLATLLHNLRPMVETARKRARHPENGLTQDESASIHLYTMQWPTPYQSLYTLLNQRLRSNDRDTLVIWYPYMKLFMTALLKLPSARPCTIWRGIRGDVGTQYDGEHIWWGVSSCTGTIEIITKFIGTEGVRTLFSIECINGKEIHAHSQYRGEKEVLLMPGTYLKVVSKVKLSEDIHLIHLREILPPYQTITSPFSSSISSAELSITNNSQTSSTALPVTTMSSTVMEQPVTKNVPVYTNPHLKQFITNNGANLELKLVFMNLIDEDMEIVTYSGLRNYRTLRYLNLSNNNIKAKGAEYLSEGIRHNDTLLKIKLFNNNIGPIGTLYISDALTENTALVSLDLSSNQIGNDGVQCLCQALYKNTTLKELNLSFNQIDINGAECLNNRFKNGIMLKELDLSGNELRDGGTHYIADGIRYNTTLECLKLASNEIKDAGLQYLSEGLSTNSTLRTLYLGGNQFQYQGIKYLTDILQNNNTLVDLDLSLSNIDEQSTQCINELKRKNRTLKISLQ